MKKVFILVSLLILGLGLYSQTTLKPTSEQFKNKEFVHEVKFLGQRVGEFWPVKGLNLVTKETDPSVFTGNLSVLHDSLRSVATAPDGMTQGYLGGYLMQGKSLSNGRPCGDGIVYDYGIVIVEKGFKITFTHKKEINNFDSLYNSLLLKKATMFFLPSIFRNGNYLPSSNMIEKVLVRRSTFKGEQIGIILFDYPISCENVTRVVLGLDRPNKSKTTHIYVLDGGPNWGQASKQINGTVVAVGTSDPYLVTNALVIY
jgi:hypothetical protein